MKNKNICIFNGNMSRSGGTERCTSILANELNNRGYNVYVIDISNKTGRCFFDLDRGIIYNNIHANSLIDGILKVRNYLNSNAIDVLINVEAMLGLYTVPANIFSKTKNIIWEHGNFYQKQCASIDKVRALEIKLCDWYITLTERDKNNFKNNFNGKCKVEYIYNPIELPKEIIKYTTDTKKILSVGVVREIKGFDMLVDVANIVLNEHKDWTWEIYGSTDSSQEYTEQIQSKIRRYNLTDRLILKGTTSDMNDCYKNCDIMVMTSRMEGLPMTLLEAKAYKRPIVAFDIETGPSEIIENEINGYLIEPYDIEEMADKINKLIDDKQLRINFSDNAYSNIGKFDMKNTIDKWVEIIES